MSRPEILEQINDEREYQIKRWGDADDQVNMPNDFVAYISHYSTKWFTGQFAPYDLETMIRFRQRMIETAAIAVAATEFADKVINGENDRFDVYDAVLGGTAPEPEATN